jgi:hypothetical protein
MAAGAYKSRLTRFSTDYRRRAPAVRQTALARQKDFLFRSFLEIRDL